MTEPLQTHLRRGAVAVIVREARLLVIRRARGVVAPGKLCFPGGGIEPGETEEEALVRELREELGVGVRPLSRLWRSITPWDVEIAWWLAELPSGGPLRPNPAEVEAVYWYTPPELAGRDDLLESNRRFLEALSAARFVIAGL